MEYKIHRVQKIKDGVIVEDEVSLLGIGAYGYAAGMHIPTEKVPEIIEKLKNAIKKK